MISGVPIRYTKAAIIRTLSWSLLVILVLSYFLIINHKVSNALPYPTHVDERHRLSTASHMLKTGDFDPGYFHKPTFPIYLTAAGLAAGFIYAAKEGKIRKIKSLGRMSYPYYRHPEIVKVAKQLFVLFASLAIFFTCYAAYKAFRFRCLLFLPALLIPFSSVYTSKSYEYINVNILGAFFVALSLSYIFYNLRQTGLAKKALIPGVLCAMTVSSKYNFLGIYLPFLLAIFFYERHHFISRTVLLLCTSAITIFLLNPYFLLNLPRFLNDTAFQVNHYMLKGHKGFEGTPGTSQFTFYMKSMIDEFGLIAFLFSILGLGYMMKVDYKKTFIFISFPLLMLLLMSASKANFLRNLTPVYMLWPVFISMGLLACYRLISASLDKKTHFSRQWQRVITSVFSIVLLISTLPFATPLEILNDQHDSRKQATKWLQQQQDITTVVIPYDLAMDTRELAKYFKIIPISRRQLNIDYFDKSLFKEKYYYLLPVYGLDKRFRGKKKLAIMHNKLSEIVENERLQPLKIFGKHKVLLNYKKTAVWGNPKFYIAKYKSHHESTEN